MDSLNRLFLIVIAIVVAHIIHLSSLGTENIILGVVTNQISYPPKSVFRWYAKSFAKFQQQDGFEKPFHFAFKQCMKFNPLSPDCIYLLELINQKTFADLNAPSNSDYKFPPIYIAIMNCNIDGIHYLRGKSVKVDTKPPSGPYARVNPLQFLYSTECIGKGELKEALYGLPNRKYMGDLLKGKDWTENKIFN